MTKEQKHELKLDVRRWMQSSAFDDYFAKLHVTVGDLCLGFVACALKPSRITPLQVIRSVRGKRLGNAALRRRYLELGCEGEVVLANIWMANDRLTSGEVDCAPAFLFAAADGSEEADNYVHYIVQKLVDLTEREAQTADEVEIMNMLAVEEYQAFRVRTLPLAYTDNFPVYLFDTNLSRSAVPGGVGEGLPLVVCLVNPHMEPAILPIPIEIVQRHISV